MINSRLRRKSQADPRFTKSRNALSKAVLELASTQPASKISVRSLTKHAGVDRSTFYNHAASPQELLRDVLREEIDEFYDAFLIDLARSQHVPHQAQERGLRAVLQHLKSRADIYRSSLHNDGDDLVMHVIGAQFIEKAQDMFNERNYPIERSDEVTEFERDFGSRVAALGMVGGITTWLLEDPALDEETFISSYYRFMPDWFTMINAKS